MKKIQKKIKRHALAIKNYFFSFRFVVFLGVLSGMLVVSYILLIFFAVRIETILTFPGKDINLKQLSNHPAGIISAEFYDISSTSGENIHGLYIDNGAAKTVYYFHGNGAPMDHFYTEMRYIGDLGYNVMSYDYPGYGKSTGIPTQDLVSDFSHEFYKAMKEKKLLDDESTIIWGYSVGTAVAIDFAKDVNFDKLILFSPLASRYDMSAKAFGIPIQKLFFRENSYISKEKIKHIPNPTLVIHGNTDTVVPFEQGKLVFENSIAEKKYFIELDDFGHSLITERYGDVLSETLKSFIETGDIEQEPYALLDREKASELLERYRLESFIDNLDLTTDSSIHKYVDPEIPFEELSYIPDDLRSLDKTHITDTKGNTQMRSEAAKQLEAMAEKFYEDMGEKMVAVSTYRSYTYQAGIKARGCPDNLCAKAGYSEHQSGLAVDFWSASTNTYWQSSPQLMKYYDWLVENAANFGFHNTYQNGVEVDGYEIEPWHWRYVGTKFANYLLEQDITFAEFYYDAKR